MRDWDCLFRREFSYYCTLHDDRHLRYADCVQAAGRANAYFVGREKHVVQVDYVLDAGGRMRLHRALWVIHSWLANFVR